MQRQFCCQSLWQNVKSCDHRLLLLSTFSLQARYKKALLFVDNAGSDVCLGMIPLARELLKLGCKVSQTQID